VRAEALHSDPHINTDDTTIGKSRIPGQAGRQD